jgi:hypothetical protein
MADQKPIAPETEQARVERVRVEEQKRYAERTAEALQNRFGNPE